MTSATPFDRRTSSLALWLWIGVVVLASLGLSRAFACAMPFAGLATLAALTLRPREACALVILAWFGNQAVGFSLMHYPWTASTFLWGLAIGVATLSGLGAGSIAASRRGVSLRIEASLALVAAYGAYELVLFATTWFLPSGPGAFTLQVVVRIFAISAAALGLLLAADRLAGSLGLTKAFPYSRLSPLQGAPGLTNQTGVGDDVGLAHYRSTMTAQRQRTTASTTGAARSKDADKPRPLATTGHSVFQAGRTTSGPFRKPRSAIT